MRYMHGSCSGDGRKRQKRSGSVVTLQAAAFLFSCVLAVTVLSPCPFIGGVLTADEDREVDVDFRVSKNAPPNVSNGRRLFEQDFRTYDGFLSGGDGLGPMFNEVSCVACHHQGAVGGGGGLRHNVDILSVSERSRAQPLTAFTLVHPGFVGSDGKFIPSLVLHRYATDKRYWKPRSRLFGNLWVKSQNDESKLQEIVQRKPVRQIEPLKHVYLLHSQRNTPALFGAGLIDRIPEELLRKQAEKEKRFGVSGRISQVSNGRIGRFGWRAQLPDLEAFVLSACANELGLSVEGHSQARNPLSDQPQLFRPEISKNDTDAMIEFVAELKSPTIDVPRYRHKSASRGWRHFNEVGCAECHVRQMGPANNVFSDFLLHDMGAGLSDPVGASREIETVTRPNPEGTGQRSFFDDPKIVNMYYVGTVLVPQVTTEPNAEDPFTDVFQRFAKTKKNPRQEWRTPPLWGCADSAPYLHDGRAPNLHEAIRSHAGDASRVKLNYMRLTKDEQKDLLTFLNCLRAPMVE